jgi:hypothetical protein
VIGIGAPPACADGTSIHDFSVTVRRAADGNRSHPATAEVTSGGGDVAHEPESPGRFTGCVNCSINEHMANYTPSRVLSVRVGEDLVEPLRARARADGRSLSGEVVAILKAQIEAERATRRSVLPITGWLAHLDVPESLADFRAARARASAGLSRRARRTRRRAR